MGVATFANAEIVIGRTEFEFWKRGDSISEMRQPTLALFRKVLLPLEDQLRLIEPGDQVVDGLSAVDRLWPFCRAFWFFRFSSGGRELVLLNDTTPSLCGFIRPSRVALFNG